jgi:putative ABC transport system permease protein
LPEVKQNAMFRNYLKVALRNLKRNPGFSLINILGLSLGLAISMLVFVFVVNELTYDRYHEKADQIYRIDTRLKAMDMDLQVATTCLPIGPYLKENYPKVLEQVRIDQTHNVLLEYGDKKFEDGIVCVDPDFFEVFTIDLVQGNAKEVLKEAFSLVMTQKMAKKYFGEEDPIGKIISGNNGRNYTVTGIIADWPANSHIKYDLLSPFENLKIMDRLGPPVSHWMGFNYRTFVVLADGFSPDSLQSAFTDIITKHIATNPIAQQFDFDLAFSLMPLKDIHLNSSIESETEPGGDIKTILIYAAIGIFILLIACINFMNLTTARSARRLREVGIRKVVGAFRSQLVFQFLCEAVLLSLISLLIAATLAEILMPEFNYLIDKNLQIEYLKHWPMTLGFILLSVLVGLIAGSYPAFYLSKFRAVAILKGKMKLGTGSVFFRNFLVVFQFGISIVLLICTFVVFLQLNFVRHADLGFDSEQVIAIPLRGAKMMQNPDLLKSGLNAIPSIEKVAMASDFPGRGRSITMFWFEGYTKEDGKTLQFYEIDEQYFDLLRIDVVKGRTFDPGIATDQSGIIINEALARQLGWEDPIGKKVMMMDVVEGEPVERQYHVVGMVKDYHHRSMHNPIEPLVFIFTERDLNYAIAKISTNNIEQSVEQIESAVNEIDNTWPFVSHFLNSQIQRHYQNEIKQSKIFVYFTILAIFIAALGLFGLASFIAEQRTKEIGIRKVLGASVGSIVKKLTLGFIKLVLFSAIIAIPVGWYLMDVWLQEFAYKIELSWWIFALATMGTLLIAFVTILYQSLKVALSKPVDAISYE